jgi:hypothetical protein
MSEPSAIFDRKLYLDRQAKASGEVVTLLWQRIADDLAERLAVINHQFEHTLLIAGKPDLPHQVLLSSGKCGNLTVYRPSESDDLKLEPQSCNAIFSLLDVQCVDDVPGYLAQISGALKPDGLAMLAFFAGETLMELRQSWLTAETELTGGVTPRVAPMIDLRETGGLLQRAGLALPVADLDRVTLRYADPLALMREVKALGYSNPLVDRSKKSVSGSLLAHSVAVYGRDSSDADGKVRATIEIAWAMAWKPHASQQQPLKPGTAKARLSDALKVKPDSE